MSLRDLSHRHNFRVFLEGKMLMAGFRIYRDLAQFLPVPRLPSVHVNT